MSGTCVIIVTHNSEEFIHKAVSCLKRQTMPPSEIVIVDSGSASTEYLNKYQNKTGITLVLEDKDIGFCAGNNLGVQKATGEAKYLLFLNPDAFLTPNFIEWATQYLEQSEHLRVGAIGGTLLGYDHLKEQPTSLYDSTGIFSTWYGKWYDRDQEVSYDPFKYSKEEEVPALCAAALFCRFEALKSVARKGEIFNSKFFMYKEDIELALRLKRKGWRVEFVPQLTAYHCRGWASDRKKMSRKFRLLSAKNELKVQLRSFSPIGSVYSLVKYFLVKCFNI